MGNRVTREFREHESANVRLLRRGAGLALIAALSVNWPLAAAAAPQHGASRLSDEPIPLAIDSMPARPAPLLEAGPPFLGTGPIGPGVRAPGGAVLQPSFQLFGSYRSGVSLADTEPQRTTRWANRLDLFGNLYFSQTERLVFGLRPLDETDSPGGRSFTGYTSVSPDPSGISGSNDHFNLDSDSITHLFFEGDFGEVFTGIDDNDRRAMDYGFSFGRQPITFQDGLLIDDSIDALGVTRNNLKPFRSVSYRITGLVAWDQINRNTVSTANLTRNAEARSARLLGLFNEFDWRFSTVSVDLIYVDGGVFRGEDAAGAAASVETAAAWYLGVGFVQRFGAVNTAFRMLASIPENRQAIPSNALGIGDPATRGSLVFAETSWTPHGSHDLMYANAFVAIDDYRMAALDPNVPGPLARAGILFAGSALGDGGAILSTASNAAGIAIGRQWFFSDTRRQLVLEAATRYSTNDCLATIPTCVPDTIAIGARFQQAFGRRGVFLVDAFIARDKQPGDDLALETSRQRIGARVELLIKL
jgi:hypothetical protein